MKQDRREEILSVRPEKSLIMKAIRKKCIDCCCGQHKEVRLCAFTDCDLWPFRFGENPYVQRSQNNTTK